MWISCAGPFTQTKRLAESETGFANSAKFQQHSEHEVTAAVPAIQGHKQLLTTTLHPLLERHKVVPLHASTLS